MQPAAPSRTAFAAAMYRAAHQELDGAALFADPYAFAVLGETMRQRALDLGGARPAMRWFIAARTAIAERALNAAVQRGVSQLVVLGAGLDTFALRNPHSRLAVFEVDHPATQSWKLAQLAAAGLVPTGETHFVPVDFERQDLAAELAAAGFDATAPAFFSWLGVVPYLTDAAIFATLELIASIPGGEVVFDYANPRDQLDPALREASEARAARAAAIGEPFLSAFDTATLHERLATLGQPSIDDLGPLRLAALAGRTAPNDRGGHVINVAWPARTGVL